MYITPARWRDFESGQTPQPPRRPSPHDLVLHDLVKFTLRSRSRRTVREAWKSRGSQDHEVQDHGGVGSCGGSAASVSGSAQLGIWSPESDVKPLQCLFSRGPFTQGARPVVATLGCDVSTPLGCRGRGLDDVSGASDGWEVRRPGGVLSGREQNRHKKSDTAATY